MDHPNTLDAGLAEVSARDESGDPASYDHDIDIFGDGLALRAGCEGIGAKPCDTLVVGKIADSRAAGNEALVALFEVLRVHDSRVEGHRSPFRRHQGDVTKDPSNVNLNHSAGGQTGLLNPCILVLRKEACPLLFCVTPYQPPMSCGLYFGAASGHRSVLLLVEFFRPRQPQKPPIVSL